MFHHLYFAGTTTAAVTFGASFSALEVVPLAIIGLETYESWSHANATPWMVRYRWPIMFFLAVSFWNLAGAGLFGFLINTPLALYYMQGLNLTPLHGHTALFGVYGMLEHGYAYARSAEFMGKPIFDVLVWMRMPGDLRFATAAALLTWFVTRHWLMPVADPGMDQTTRTDVVEAVQQEVV